jgi:3-oxosteroid 1-dehydrogenase
MSQLAKPARRRLLASGAGLAAALPFSSHAAPAEAWDQEVDVICVGSGAAACTAAIVATGAGAKALIVEKLPLVGGTTGKSGGVAWIPNNFLLRQKGVVDRKEDCLRYMARYAYPERYDARSATLGLDDADFRLLEAFYDNGSLGIDRLQALDVVKFNEFRLYKLNRPAPDYGDGLAENKVPAGRALEPVGADFGAGRLLIDRMEAWLESKHVPILTETRVQRVVKEDGRVVGVEAIDKTGKRLRLRARRGVVFGTGGFAHNTELAGLHQPSMYGACAMPGSTGDFIAIAAEAGAAMGSLSTGWRGQVVLEEALANRAVGSVVFGVPGDSMVQVNKYGRRVVNEKLNYNDRTRVHFAYDAQREEYPNHLLFMVYDRRCADAFAGDFPFPADARESRYAIEGRTLDELVAKITQRLAVLAPKTGGTKLAPDFGAELGRTLKRFNEDARSGNDRAFDRGSKAYDREWHALFSPVRAGSKFGANPHPNVTMHPLSEQGPYYCLILGAGALDTNAGPRINASAQVLDARGEPIPGLYGAGNCVASPSRGAYFAAGGTIGAAITFGYIAAQHALNGKRSA